jgi:hypothetical protein
VPERLIGHPVRIPATCAPRSTTPTVSRQQVGRTPVECKRRSLGEAPLQSPRTMSEQLGQRVQRRPGIRPTSNRFVLFQSCGRSASQRWVPVTSVRSSKDGERTGNRPSIAHFVPSPFHHHSMMGTLALSVLTADRGQSA